MSAAGAETPGAVSPLPTLAGQHCTLRPLRSSDARSLQRHADDPAVAHNLFDGFPQPYTLVTAEDWCGDGHQGPRFGHVFGIEVAGEGGAAIAGCISVAPQGGVWGSSAEVGYWLGRAHWRRGITSEALAMITAWAWQALPQTMRLWAPIYARNTGSRGVARKAGYVQEGFMPFSILKDGQAIDAVCYGAYRPGLPPRQDLPATAT